MVLMKFMAVPVAVLVILAGFLTTNPSVAGFFNEAKDRFFSFARIEPPVDRNTGFSVELDRYDAVEFDRQSPMNVTVRGEAYAVFQNGDVRTGNGIRLVNYRGYGSVSDSLLLNGTHERLESAELVIGRGKVWLESNFSSLEITGLRVRMINLSGVSGTLRLGNNSVRFSESIEISEPLGTFSFSGPAMSIAGTAQKISIPSAGINIG